MYSPISLPSPLVTRRRLPPTPVDGSPHPTHRRLCEVRSAVPFEMSSPLLAAPMRQPLRSQSFKHRPKPLVEVKRSALEDVCVERRRSTPTVSRRCSLQRGRLMERTDVWPEARVASEAEERFLKLPDAEDYTRVRQISIDKKGAVVSRGDSFRRKKTTKFAMDKSPSPYITSGSDSARGSRSGSPSSSDDGLVRDFSSVESGVPAGTSHNSYKIFVIGDTGTGKSSLIAQLITSEYRNAFADEIQDYESTVSICIGGQECDLIFMEHDLSDATWLQSDIQSFVVVYSIDSRGSWKQALNAVEMARNNPRTMHVPILMAGNKIDLERKRTVTKNEVRAAAAQYGFEQFEISVALNHDVDELLVGLVAEIQEAFSPRHDMITPTPTRVEDDFHAAIRRYSMRKKKEVPAELAPGKCSALSPAGLFNKLKNWRRGSIPRIQT